MCRTPVGARDATVALAAPARGLIRRLPLRLARVELVQQQYVIWDDALSQRWHTAYRTPWNQAATAPSSRCPTCGVKGHLRVEYTGVDDQVGYAAMWCGRCRTGIVTCRSRIPAGVARRVPVAADTRPDFVLIYAYHDLPRSLRWARNTTAALALVLAATALTGALLWLLGDPAAGFVLTDLRAWVFRAFGTSCAASLWFQLRLRRTRPEHTFPAATPAASPRDQGMPPPPPRPGDQRSGEVP